MDDLRLSPHEIDPDEVIRLFVPNAPEVDQTKDKRLWMLAQKLAEAFSTHNASTHLMEADPEWDFMAVYYRAVDEISHQFMPYHAPRMEGIPEADFEMYREVVNSTYRLHDLFLQRLMQLAGPDAAVMLVSDHGFHSDHLRPNLSELPPERRMELEATLMLWKGPSHVNNWFEAATASKTKDAKPATFLDNFFAGKPAAK
jgi:predicted AlkP superfamily pyrophosphatase or phosphodiesterase